MCCLLARTLATASFLVVVAAGATHAQEPPNPEVSPEVEPESLEDEGFGDDDFGEDDFDFDMDMSEVSDEAPSPFSLTGRLKSAWALWAERLDDHPWAKGRQSLDLKFDGRWDAWRVLAEGHGEIDLAYFLQDVPSVRQSEKDTYAWQVLPREVMVSYGGDSWGVTLGRQIVTWGEGDAMSVLDLACPRDNREPGLTDLDDARMSVLATRIGWYPGTERLELFWIHEADFGLRSPPLGPFSFLEAFLDDALPGAPAMDLLLAKEDVRFEHQQARFSLEGQQVLARWLHSGQGLDLGVTAGWVLDQQGVITLPQELTPPVLHLPVEHRPYAIVGTSGAWGLGSWLLKWEAGAEIGRAWNVSPSPPELEVAEADRVLTLVAATWTPYQDLSLGFEMTKSWFLEEPEGLLVDLNYPNVLLRATWRTLRERLAVYAALAPPGPELAHGWLARVDVDYELTQGIVLTVGGITYHPGEELSPFSGLTRHDRFIVRARWDFTLL